MGELLAAFAEAIAGLFAAVLEAMPVIVEALVYLITASIIVIAYFISPGFREKKRNEWAGNPTKKYLDLGVNAVCIAALVSAGIWVGFQLKHHARGAETFQVNDDGTHDEVRLGITTASAHGATNEIEILVKRGDLKKILKTDSLHQFEQAIRGNVTVVHLKSSPHLTGAETNQITPSDGSNF